MYGSEILAAILTEWLRITRLTRWDEEFLIRWFSDPAYGPEVSAEMIAAYQLLSESFQPVFVARLRSSLLWVTRQERKPEHLNRLVYHLLILTCAVGDKTFIIPLKQLFLTGLVCSRWGDHSFLPLYVQALAACTPRRPMACAGGVSQSHPHSRRSAS